MPQTTHQPTSRATSTRRRPSSSPGSSPVELPSPKLSGGKSLPESLRRRQTIREISDKKLPLQLLSNLLWAACGVNRRKGPFGTPGITAASASDSQEIDLFVAMENGVYLFDAQHHQLLPVVACDLRTLAIGRGQQNLAMNAPVQIIYVVDIQDAGHWDWSKGEPPKHNPAYYLRFCKSFSRMGGTMHYLQCDNVVFLHNLLRQLDL